MSEHKSFWSTLPGVLTSIAVLITAITGLYVALVPTDSQTVAQETVYKQIATYKPETSASTESRVDQQFIIMDKGLRLRLYQGAFASSSECGKRIDQLSDPHNYASCRRAQQTVFCFMELQYGEFQVNSLNCFERIEWCRNSRVITNDLNTLEQQAGGARRETENCVGISLKEAMAKI